MWMRNSDQQVAREHSRLRLSFRGPVFSFLIMFIGGIGIAIQGPHRAGGGWPHTWPEVLSGATLLAGIVAVFHYALQLVLQRRINALGISDEVVICDTCYRVKRRDGEGICGCGATFDDFDKWTWIDDES
jgi:hypothetical protein